MKKQNAIFEQHGTVIWDLATEAPELIPCLPLSVQAVLDGIRRTGNTRAARYIAPFDEGGFFRPERHVRAFYQQVEDWGDGDAVLAFKGSEVWSSDLRAVAAEMSQGRTCLNKHDYFIMGEQKTPILYLKHEALSDARNALSLFRAVHSTFCEHPKLPLPLIVVEWPSECLAAYRDAVLPFLSDTAKGMVERNLREGVAQYVYFFPGSPARLRHAKHNALQLLEDMERTYRIVDSWVNLFTQILCSGYFPTVLSNQKWGCCIQDQNVCIDGGFVDVDSVEAISVDKTMFAANLLASMQMLSHSIFAFLSPLLLTEDILQPVLGIENVFGGSLHHMLFFPHVWRMVQNRFNQFTASGITADRRLISIFEGDGIKALTHMLIYLQPLMQRKTNEALRIHTFA
jgi:hypothetical protein